MEEPIDKNESFILLSDLNEAIPETELLDNSIQKGRAQLSVKTRRHRPSRSRYRDSVSSTEGDDSLDRKVGGLLQVHQRVHGWRRSRFVHISVCVCFQDSTTHSARSPLHLAMRGSSPSPDSLLSARSPGFTFDTSLVRPSEIRTGVSVVTKQI